MLAAARAALARQAPAQFLLVQQGGGGAAFARTLHLEAPGLTTCVVDVPLDHPRAANGSPPKRTPPPVTAKRITMRKGADTNRRFDSWNLKIKPPPNADPDSRCSAGDRRWEGHRRRMRLAWARDGSEAGIAGAIRSRRGWALAANLERMRAAGVHVLYVAADVANPAAIAAAFHEIENRLGR